jgi:hypothetical protein
MNDHSSISWWGFRRRPPRFWQPPKVKPWEAVGLATPFSCLLVGVAWLGQLIWFEELVTRNGLSQSQFLQIAAWLYGSPLLLALGAWLLGFFRFGDVLDIEDREKRRTLLGLILLLREMKALLVLDLLLAALPVGVTLILWRWEGFDLMAHWRDWPLLGAAVLTALLLRAFRTNPFIPRVRSLEIPSWVRELAATLPGAEAAEADDETSKACRTVGLVPPDTTTDPSHYISLELPTDDLSPEFRRLGIQLRPGLRQEMEEILSKSGPDHFKNNHFRGSLEMIDATNGILGGAGAVELRRLAAQILTRANYAGWGRLKLAEVVLHLTQSSITYAQDKESTGIAEYGRFPLQTLADRKGDCEDTAMLLCAMLCHLGIECAFVITEIDNDCGHAATALKLQGDSSRLVGEEGVIHHAGSSWLYGETTLDGSFLGWGMMPPGQIVKHLIPVPVEL